MPGRAEAGRGRPVVVLSVRQENPRKREFSVQPCHDTADWPCGGPAKKALKPLAAGDTLTVIATDPSAPKDFEEFCAATGYGLVENRAEGEDFIIIVRKA